MKLSKKRNKLSKKRKKLSKLSKKRKKLSKLSKKGGAVKTGSELCNEWLQNNVWESCICPSDFDLGKNNSSNISPPGKPCIPDGPQIDQTDWDNFEDKDKKKIYNEAKTLWSNKVSAPITARERTPWTGKKSWLAAMLTLTAPNKGLFSHFLK